MLKQKMFLLLYDKTIFFNKKIKYIAKIKFIMHIIIQTKINIAFKIFIINYFSKNWDQDYFSDIDQILKYLTRTLTRNITFKKKLTLISFNIQI